MLAGINVTEDSAEWLSLGVGVSRISLTKLSELRCIERSLRNLRVTA